MQHTAKLIFRHIVKLISLHITQHIFTVSHPHLSAPSPSPNSAHLPRCLQQLLQPPFSGSTFAPPIPSTASAYLSPASFTSLRSHCQLRQPLQPAFHLQASLLSPPAVSQPLTYRTTQKHAPTPCCFLAITTIFSPRYHHKQHPFLVQITLFLTTIIVIYTIKRKCFLQMFNNLLFHTNRITIHFACSKSAEQTAGHCETSHIHSLPKSPPHGIFKPQIRP